MRRKRDVLVVEDVVLYARDADGNEWKLVADQGEIRLRGDDLVARFSRRQVWGECALQIIRLAEKKPRVSPGSKLG